MKMSDKFIEWTLRNPDAVIRISSGISIIGVMLVNEIEDKVIRLVSSIFWCVFTFTIAGFAAYINAYSDRGDQ